MMVTTSPGAGSRRRAGVWAAASVLAGALLGAIIPATPSSAQFIVVKPLSMRELSDSLADRGYRMVGRPRRSGDAYVVEGIGPGGRRTHLVIDAFDGTVIRGAAVAPSGESAVGGSTAGIPSEAGSSLGNQNPRLVPPLDVPGAQRSIQAPEQAAPGRGREKREATVRREGQELNAVQQRLPERRKVRAHAKPDRSGSAALPEKPEKPAEDANRAAPEKVEHTGRVPDKAAAKASADDGRKPADAQARAVAPVLLDDVKPQRHKDPPPMPEVQSLE